MVTWVRSRACRRQRCSPSPQMASTVAGKIKKNEDDKRRTVRKNEGGRRSDLKNRENAWSSPFSAAVRRLTRRKTQRRRRKWAVRERGRTEGGLWWTCGGRRRRVVADNPPERRAAWEGERREIGGGRVWWEGRRAEGVRVRERDEMKWKEGGVFIYIL